tara:strand:+ start:1038 stop:1190 length:153 start_codon:yes stop_codon:yes gene_type:complete
MRENASQRWLWAWMLSIERTVQSRLIVTQTLITDTKTTNTSFKDCLRLAE